MKSNYRTVISLTALVVLSVIFVYTTTISEPKKESKDTTVKKEKKELIPNADGKVILTDEQWKERLTEEEYRVLRGAGTEVCGTGIYNNTDKKGSYSCSACGALLFLSNSKYHSGSGWPAFFEPASESAITQHRDTSWGMIRVEVKCARCDSHLGHVFEDGPPPTGLRFCINSVCLDFKEEKPEN